MSVNSEISWTDATWNPCGGCEKISAGCKHCYAIPVVTGLVNKLPEKARAFYADLVQDGNWTGVVKLNEGLLDRPLRWQAPKRIFVASLSDPFHHNLSFSAIGRIFAVMASSPRHTYQLLTKRPARMAEFFRTVSLATVIDQARSYVSQISFQGKEQAYDHLLEIKNKTWPLPNVQLGTSVEDQRSADTRIPLLIESPAAIRFLSCEPLLGHVELPVAYLGKARWSDCVDADYGPGRERLPGGIQWVICGGESGKGHRAMNLAWARHLRDQCVAAGVAYFFKQSSGAKAGMEPMLDGVEWKQFP